MDKKEVTAYENKHEFIPIFCQCYKPNPKFLGYFQVDITHMSKYYCKECKAMHSYFSDDFGIIRKIKVKGEKPLCKSSEEPLMGDE